MTKQELIKVCNDRIIDYREELELENPELEFYKDIYDLISGNDYDSYVKLENGKAFLGYFDSISDYDLLDKNVKGVLLAFEYFSLCPMSKIEIFIRCLQNDTYDDIFNIHSGLNYIKKTKTINDNFGSKYPLIVDIFEKLDNRDFDWLCDAVGDLFSIINGDKALFIESLNKLYAFMDFKDFYSVLDSGRRRLESEDGFVVTDDEQYEIITMMIKNEDFYPELKELISVLRKQYTAVYKNNSKDRTRLNKSINVYKKFIDDVNKVFNNKEITNYESIISKIDDEEIKIEFLKMVFQHNNIEYNQLDREYEELSNNSYINYLSIIKELNISKDEVNIENIMRLSFQDFRNMVETLKDMKLSKEFMIKALEQSDLSTISKIKNLTDNNIISWKTLEANPSILDDGNVLEEVEYNLNLFRELDLNATNLINNPEVIINNSDLEKNIELLKEYNLANSIKAKSNYKYLSIDDLEVRINKLLELGFENYLEEDLTLLNFDTIDRLYILKNLNIPVESKNELFKVLRGKDFIVPDDTIDEYIPNISDKYDEDISINLTDLSKYSNNRVYDINGVLLSKVRVKKNMSDGYSTFKSLLLGSVLSIEDVYKIKSEFSDKAKVK